MKPHATILIIDDEPAVQRMLATFFQRHGCQVSVARNGQEGIDAVCRDHFDLIILDLNMPHLAGIEALPRLRELNPEARIVVLTGYGSYESKVEAREHGIYDYLLKPVNLEKIRAMAACALPDRQAFSSDTDDTRVRLLSGARLSTIAREIAERIARAFCLIAIAKEADVLTVAMADPSDLIALDTVRAHTGVEIRAVAADRYEIQRAIDDAYRGPMPDA